MAVARWLLGARLMYSEFMAGNITPNPVPRSSGTVKNIVVAAAGLTDTARRQRLSNRNAAMTG